MKWSEVMLAVGLGCLAAGVGMGLRQGGDKETKIEVIKKESRARVGESQVVNKVLIDVAGEVVKPGVYEVDEGSRVNEVLIKAGGLGVNADREWVEKNINKAAVVSDGEKIFIPKVGEVAGVAAEIKPDNGKISLNRGTPEDFDRLSGIGPAIAQRIIDYRAKNGKFVSVEEIKLVSGIGDKMYEKIKNQIEL